SCTGFTGPKRYCQRQYREDTRLGARSATDSRAHDDTRDHRFAEVAREAASAELRTGMISNSTRSFQRAVHSSNKLASSVSISWKHRSRRRASTQLSM